MNQSINPLAASDALSHAEGLVNDGRVFDAIEFLHQTNQTASNSDLECRLAALRHQAFGSLVPASKFETWPVRINGYPAEPPQVPKVTPDNLSAENVRQGIAAHGSVHVPGLLSTDQVRQFTDGIQHALSVRVAQADTPFKRGSSWFSALKLSREDGMSLGRNWIAGAGGMLACDSPHLLDMIFSTYEAVGLRSMLTEYLGERPILSANKCTLREVPLTAKTDWHQDGAFLGTGIRALNVWIALTDCGVEAPGMDLVPRRFETVQETGTGGAIFDWAVGPDTVAELAADHPVVRPQFMAGDALLFDDLYLHRTAIDPAMVKPRYAIESWFFAATDYPAGQVPLVW